MSLFNSKSAILNPQWIEIVFSDRNKSYGAYMLRKENAKSTVKAMIITVGLFATAVAAPTIINKIKGFIPNAPEKPHIIEATIIQPPPIDKTNPPPPPPPHEPPRPKTDVLRFPPPVVRPDDQVKEKDPPTVDELKDATTGQKDIHGDPNASVNIDEPPGTANVKQITEDDKTIFVSVENSAEYMGGMDKFYEYLGRAIHYPAVARENGVQGKVILTFVVEKDGSLTDIHVLRGIGSGCDEEAQRVVKASKKWKPGMQNGQPVRQQYTVPINFTLAEN